MNKTDQKLRPHRFATLLKSAFEKASQYGEIISPDMMAKDELENYRQRQVDFHPSSMPYCGLRDAWVILADEGRKRTMGSDFFFGAGHAFHSAVQHGMSRAANVYGNWKCRKCDNSKTFCTLPDEGVCPKCGSVWEYEELGGKVKKKGMASINWHSDGLVELRGEYWVLDYKTTSGNQIAAHRKTGEVFPYLANREQIRTYCVLFEKVYKVKVSGYALVYVARDNPTYASNVEVVAERVEPGDIEEWTERLVKAARAKLVASKVKEAPIQVFKKLQPVRLCPNRSFYEQNIHSPYNECPLADFCQKPDLLLATLKEEMRNLGLKIPKSKQRE